MYHSNGLYLYYITLRTFLISLCWLLTRHISCSKQKTNITVDVTDHPVLPFGVHILQQNVMYKDIPLTTLDIPHSLPLLV